MMFDKGEKHARGEKDLQLFHQLKERILSYMHTD